MKNIETRSQDITHCVDQPFVIFVDGQPIKAIEGESILSALLASDIRQLMQNDYGKHSGAYCGMGVCHCCLLHGWAAQEKGMSNPRKTQYER